MTLSPDQKGERAQRILADEVFQEAVERAKEKVTDQWTRESVPEQRERLWQRYQAIRAVPEALEIMRTEMKVHRHRQEKQRG